MINEVLNYLKNYFYKFLERDNYNIVDGKIKVKGKYIKGQYIAIRGSIVNDGVHKVELVENDTITVLGLNDEEFEGTICSLAIPKDVLKIADEIEKFEANNVKTNLASESFANYSYSIAKDKDGGNVTWQGAFRKSLAPYKKMYDNIGYVKEVK